MKELAFAICLRGCIRQRKPENEMFECNFRCRVRTSRPKVPNGCFLLVSLTASSSSSLYTPITWQSLITTTLPRCCLTRASWLSKKYLNSCSKAITRRRFTVRSSPRKNATEPPWLSTPVGIGLRLVPGTGRRANSALDAVVGGGPNGPVMSAHTPLFSTSPGPFAHSPRWPLPPPWRALPVAPATRTRRSCAGRATKSSWPDNSCIRAPGSCSGWTRAVMMPIASNADSVRWANQAGRHPEIAADFPQPLQPASRA